mmetsp:Transcript_27798/g.24414  ORF Transcript_27798/g.24414 Transcript_27798/m.24414 type:complete len:685 (+) Transcript_27798:1989-4043(+)
MYGVHIISTSGWRNDSAVARISYCEIRQAGQAFQMGRYPIHYHLIGAVHKSYVLGNAIHHTYNRAVTTHGVHFLKVQKNVAYWNKGHAYFIEDGIETNNLYEDNLAINTISSESLLTTDQTPACFWITNPNNIWRRNRCGGSDRYGFWFDLREHPTGASATTSVCPRGERLGVFEDNEAHSTGRYALRVFDTHIPRQYPCRGKASGWDPHTKYDVNPPITANYRNFFGWKNIRNSVIAEHIGAVTFTNMVGADNMRACIEISVGNEAPPRSWYVSDAWCIGQTEYSIDDSLYQSRRVMGLITPKRDWFLAENIRFFNYTGSMTAIEHCSHCEYNPDTDSGGRVVYVRDLSFDDATVEHRLRYNIPYRGIFVDEDGTLSGTGTKSSLTFDYPHLMDDEDCNLSKELHDGLVCNENVNYKRILVYDYRPGEFGGMDLRVLRVDDLSQTDFSAVPLENYSKVQFRHYRNPFDHWVFVARTGKNYKVHWANGLDFDHMRFTRADTMIPAETYMDPALELPIMLIHNHSEFRETWRVNANGQSMGNDTSLAGAAALRQCAIDSIDDEDKHCKFGNWTHDVENQLWYAVIDGQEFGNQNLDVDSVRCDLNCPKTAGKGEIEDTVYWSRPEDWLNRTILAEGDEVTIERKYRVVFDVCESEKLHDLTIIGELRFCQSTDTDDICSGAQANL